MGRIPHLCPEPMRILLVTPAPPRARNGNRITALRWSRILQQLGHYTAVAQEYKRQSCDLLVALHARRSFASLTLRGIGRWRGRRGRRARARRVGEREHRRRPEKNNNSITVT